MFIKPQPLLRYITCIGLTFLCILLVQNISSLLSQEKLSENLRGVLDNQRFVSCEIALSLLANNEISIKNALSPNALADIFERPPCDSLEKFYAGENDQAESATLRLRYTWGVRSIYAPLVYFIPEPMLETVLSLATVLACVVLIFLLFSVNKLLGLIALPFGVFGISVSGIFSIAEAPMAINYLWAWTAACLIVWSIKHDVDKEVCLVAGMVSSYLWLMDGHFVLLACLCALVCYLCTRIQQSDSAAIKKALVNSIFLHLGFLICTFLFFLFKVGVFGLDAVVDNYAVAI